MPWLLHDKLYRLFPVISVDFSIGSPQKHSCESQQSSVRQSHINTIISIVQQSVFNHFFIQIGDKIGFALYLHTGFQN